MEKKGWKITAIIFIILFVLETAFISYSIYLSKRQQQDVKKCIIDVCGYDVDAQNWTRGFYDYYYEQNSRTCYCLDKNGEPRFAKEFG